MAQNKSKSRSEKNYTKKGSKFTNKSRKPRESKEERGGYTGEPGNNPKYYQVNPIMSALSAAIPVNPVLGTKPAWGTNDHMTGSFASSYAGISKTAIPGIMGITLTPAFGSDMGNNPASASFNRLCGNLYSQLVKDKSGTAPFDQAAVGHYLIAMRSAYIIVHDLQRFIATVTHFRAYNRYFPKGVGYALGRSDYALNASEIDAAIWEVNKLVRFLNTKYVPSMSVFLRDYDLYSRYYADSETEQAQYYAFIPRGYYLYNDTDNKSVFNAFGTTIPNLPKSLSDITTLVDTIIDSIQNSDIFNIINAWMRHTWDPATSFKLAEMQFGAEPVFMYDELILSQIENMRTVPIKGTGLSGLDIKQAGSNNYLEYSDLNTGISPGASSHLVGFSCDPTFNFHVSVPTEELKLEASRLVVTADEEAITYSSTDHYASSNCSGFTFSDQIPGMLLIAEWDDNAQTFTQSRFYNTWCNEYSYDVGGEVSYIQGMMSQFKHHPIGWVWVVRADSSNKITVLRVNPMGDMDTVGSLSKDAFKRLSYTCTYSLFTVPNVTA